MSEPITLKKLFNPSVEDFKFKHGGAEYTVPAGKSMDFVDYVAFHGAKKMADLHAKTSDPDERKVLMKSYLDNISVEKSAESLGIRLDAILAKAAEKGKEKARMNNLESQVDTQKKQIDILTAKLEQAISLLGAKTEKTPEESKDEVKKSKK